jgi:hypothetical protein
MAENQVAGHFDPLKHHFLELDQVGFWASKKAENNFEEPRDSLIHHIFELPQIAF